MADAEPRPWIVRLASKARQPGLSLLDGAERRRARALAWPQDRIRHAAGHTTLRLLHSAETRHA
ncbi:hypothetical protein AB5L52_00530 [Streptomyces sp. CG4]|uniref:hypothetical protein n=1 Tax=Streptomyces sp. CG4 TaxID=408783 RepID=UPI0034E1DCF4